MGRGYTHPVATWRCPHCGTVQAASSRCWACARTPAACRTCRHYRRSVAERIGYCAADRSRGVVAADDVRPCWVPPAPVVPEDGLFAGIPIADPRTAAERDADERAAEVAAHRRLVEAVPTRIAVPVGSATPGAGTPALPIRDVAPWIAPPPAPPADVRWPDPAPRAPALPLRPAAGIDGDPAASPPAAPGDAGGRTGTLRDAPEVRPARPLGASAPAAAGWDPLLDAQGPGDRDRGRSVP